MLSKLNELLRFCVIELLSLLVACGPVWPGGIVRRLCIAAPQRLPITSKQDGRND